MCLALTLILGIKGKQDFRAQGCFIASAGHTSSEVPRTCLCQSDFFGKRSIFSHVLGYYFNGPSLCSGNSSNAARIFTARQAATKICAANCANGSFAQFAAKESSQKSKKPAISSTKWSNFAKPEQTRAKARVPGVGTLLGMRHAR